MAFLIGAVLAVGVAMFARAVGLDRDRAFYPTALLVVASYYVLFAVMGGSTTALGAELATMTVFLGVVAVGFRRNLWLVVVGLAAHGIFDAVHPHLVDNPGVPAWWPSFCMAYDVTAAAGLAWLLHRRDSAASPPRAG